MGNKIKRLETDVEKLTENKNLDEEKLNKELKEKKK